MLTVVRMGQSVNLIRDLSMSEHLRVNTGGPSSSCEMIILRNKSHGKIIRVCIGKFMTAFRNTKIQLKRTHFSELNISRFTTKYT